MVWQDRSFQSIDCGTLALDESRMLTKEEQMEPEMTCTSNDTTEKMKLYMSMELSQKEWKLGFSTKGGFGDSHHQYSRWRHDVTSTKPWLGRGCAGNGSARRWRNRSGKRRSECSCLGRWVRGLYLRLALIVETISLRGVP